MQDRGNRIDRGLEVQGEAGRPGRRLGATWYGRSGGAGNCAAQGDERSHADVVDASGRRSEDQHEAGYGMVGRHNRGAGETGGTVWVGRRPPRGAQIGHQDGVAREEGGEIGGLEQRDGWPPAGSRAVGRGPDKGHGGLRAQGVARRGSVDQGSYAAGQPLGQGSDAGGGDAPRRVPHPLVREAVQLDEIGVRWIIGGAAQHDPEQVGEPDERPLDFPGVSFCLTRGGPADAKETTCPASRGRRRFGPIREELGGFADGDRQLRTGKPGLGGCGVGATGEGRENDTPQFLGVAHDKLGIALQRVVGSGGAVGQADREADGRDDSGLGIRILGNDPGKGEQRTGMGQGLDERMAMEACEDKFLPPERRIAGRPASDDTAINQLSERSAIEPKLLGGLDRRYRSGHGEALPLNHPGACHGLEIRRAGRATLAISRSFAMYALSRAASGTTREQSGHADENIGSTISG